MNSEDDQFVLWAFLIILLELVFTCVVDQIPSWIKLLL